jgi:hypothetical protein
VERCVSERIDDDDSQRYGAVGSRHQSCDDLQVGAEELFGVVVAPIVGWTKSVH